MTRNDVEQKADLIDAFIRQQGSAHTRRAYRRDLATLFGQTTVAAEMARSITPAEIDGLLRRGESEGLAVSTLRRRLSAIRRFYDWLTAEGVATQNPARHGSVRKPMKRPELSRADGDTDDRRASDGRLDGQPNNDPHNNDAHNSGGTGDARLGDPSRGLSRKQAEALVHVLDTQTRAGRRDLAIIQLILHCALRRSEVVAVNTEDFRLVGAFWVMDVRSRQSDVLSGRTGSDGEITGKAARYRRNETLSERSKVPDHVLGHVEAVRMDLGDSGGALFRSLSNQNRGARLTGDAVYRIVRSAGRRAGIDDVTPDRLRQTGLRLAIENGATVDQARAHGRYTPSGPFQAASRREERLRSSAADYVRIGVDLEL